MVIKQTTFGQQNRAILHGHNVNDLMTKDRRVSVKKRIGRTRNVKKAKPQVNSAKQAKNQAPSVPYVQTIDIIDYRFIFYFQVGLQPHLSLFLSLRSRHGWTDQFSGSEASRDRPANPCTRWASNLRASVASPTSYRLRHRCLERDARRRHRLGQGKGVGRPNQAVPMTSSHCSLLHQIQFTSPDQPKMG